MINKLAPIDMECVIYDLDVINDRVMALRSFASLVRAADFGRQGIAVAMGSSAGNKVGVGVVLGALADGISYKACSAKSLLVKFGKVGL